MEQKYFRRRKLFGSLLILLFSTSISFSQEWDVNWIDLDGTSFTGTTLEKTSSSSGFNADAHSEQVIPANQDGYLQYEVNANDGSQMIGFTDENNGTAGGDMQYRFYFTWNPYNIDRHVRIIVHGTVEVSHAGMYDLGDKYRIRREGTQMHFEKQANGTSGWTNLHTNDAYIPAGSSTLPELIVDCSIYHPGASIQNTKISCGAPVYAVLKDRLDGTFLKCQGGILRFKYEERYFFDNAALEVNIYDSSNDVLYTPSNLSKSTGINLYDIDLASTGLFTDQEFYTLRIRDGKGNPAVLRFQYND